VPVKPIFTTSLAIGTGMRKLRGADDSGSRPVAARTAAAT